MCLLQREANALGAACASREREAADKGRALVDAQGELAKAALRMSRYTLYMYAAHAAAYADSGATDEQVHAIYGRCACCRIRYACCRIR